MSQPINYSAVLNQLLAGHDLSHELTRAAFQQLLSGGLTTAQIAGLLVGLRVKGETAEEVAAAAQVMRDLVTPVELPAGTEVVDLCGTGGDGAQTFNISTACMFVLAGAGAKVGKHGGRSVSSNSGSADVLELLGVNINLKPVQVAQSIEQVGIGFMFAPNHHPAMKNVAPVRKELGIKTIFNILGPLTNPAGAPNILMGVFHADLVGIQVRALQRLGAEHALVVYGKDGMDEVSLGAGTLVGELKNGQVEEYEIHPEDFGFTMASNRSLKVETPEQSRTMLMGVLDDEPGAARDIVLLNAGVALYAANVAESMEAGIALARQALSSGAAKAKLDQLVSVAHELSA